MKEGGRGKEKEKGKERRKKRGGGRRIVIKAMLVCRGMFLK